VLPQIHRLFERGSVSGLSEWQLLDRYASRRDESAFEALVARHGPMVLGVCRRVLDDPHAVDDAFQATFLVLVRKAGTLGEHDAIGHWLYGVACRVALRARCETARRHAREVPVERAEGVVRGDEPGDAELAPILDEELSRLPSKYRAPIVLCYLEGLTHEEAARQLGWPVGSVKGRLARAKEQLRGRLARRGLSPSAGLLAVSLSRQGPAAVPRSLVLATVQSALQLTAGPAAAGAVSVSVSIVRLMEGALSAMFVTKLKVATMILGTAGCLTLGTWSLAQFGGGVRPVAGPGPVPAATAAEGKEDEGVKTAREAALRSTLAKPMALSLQKVQLEEVLKTIKAMSQTPNDPGVPIYVDTEGLRETGATINSPITIDATKQPLETALDDALRPLKLGATVRDGLLVVTSRSEVTLIELRSLNAELRRMRLRPGVSTAEPSRAVPPTAAEVDPKDQLIREALERPVHLHLQETPFKDAIPEIRKVSISPGLPEGIPIYWNPRVDTLLDPNSSTVTIDLKDVKLKTSLRLMLNQVGLTYTIKEGLLIIDSYDSAEINQGRPPMRGGGGFR
jgi:RNA polymerase sigma factor (sigma-70 family)